MACAYYRLHQKNIKVFFYLAHFVALREEFWKHLPKCVFDIGLFIVTTLKIGKFIFCPKSGVFEQMLKMFCGTYINNPKFC